MKILGVGFLTDASACVLIDGKLVSAISEERLNRVKQWHGIPRAAIQEVLRIAGISIDEIDYIATHGQCASAPDPRPFNEKEKTIFESELPEDIKREQIYNLKERYKHEMDVFSNRTPSYLNDIRQFGKPIKVVGHHEAHAASAYYGSGWDDCYVLTMDGWGEDGCSTLSIGNKGTLELVAQTSSIDSMGYFYGSITKSLGFIPERHEGKVLGLAAYCHEPKSYSVIRSMIDYDSSRRSFVGRMERGLYIPRFNNSRLSDFVKKYSREDVAAATQKSLEEVVLDCVRNLDPKRRRIALAGGIFANVKLNQRILEAKNIDEVYVFPNMGDGGLSVGAAWLTYFRETGKRPMPLSNVYLGSEFSDQDIGNALQESGLKYEFRKDIQNETARLLAEGEIVIRFHGRMEYGPRALCHRSILYQATDPSVNKWLNDRLKRSEFMPFAPVTLAEEASRFYLGIEGGREAARYMAMTFDCTPEMLQESPAAVHVDHTARPQIISTMDNPDMYAILTEYRRLTGRYNLINTSFNMHEEPIVCSVDDALKAFHESMLPYMAMGNFLVKNNTVLNADEGVVIDRRTF
jgi:carbamoyltransferase